MTYAEYKATMENTADARNAMEAIFSRPYGGLAAYADIAAPAMAASAPIETRAQVRPPQAFHESQDVPQSNSNGERI